MSKKSLLLWCDYKTLRNPKKKKPPHLIDSSLAVMFAALSPASFCLRGVEDAVMFPAGAHTLNAVYFAELMAASLNQHVGGWRAACTPKKKKKPFDFLSGAVLFISWSKRVKSTYFCSSLTLGSTSKAADLFWMLPSEELNPISVCKLLWIRPSDKQRDECKCWEHFWFNTSIQMSSPARFAALIKKQFCMLISQWRSMSDL